MFILKWIRVLAAFFVFTSLLFLFVDISSIASLSLHHLAEIQFVPLLLRGGLVGGVGVILWLIVTLIFGRFYCSSICPFGILQDVISRFAKFFRRRNCKYSYRPAMSKTRNIIFVLFLFGVAAMMFFGVAAVVILFDPYSNFGRISFSIFQPAVIFLNNRIAGVSDLIGGAGFQPRGIHLFGGAFIISLAIFFLVVILSFFYGRRYCNVICPVGTLFGFISKFSLFRVKLDKSKCIKCGLCERNCKGECIDSKNFSVDSSRCVTCFNCFGVCRKGAILYSPISLALFSVGKVESSNSAAIVSDEVHSGRRRFLRLSFLSLIFSTIGGGAMNPDDPYGDSDPYGNDTSGNKVPDVAETVKSAAESVKTAETTESVVTGADLELADKTSRVSYVNDTIVLPPGARSLKNFRSKCSSCHLCVSKCPSRVLQPGAIYSNSVIGGSGSGGIFGLVQPSLQFDHHYCNKNCTVCGDVCPTSAIERVTVEERELLKIGTVEFLIDNCVVYTQGTSCGACQEHCSNGAIKMVPYGDPSKHLTIPELHPEFCIGCGGCESICPVRPYRAIYIKGATEQTKAKLSYDPNEKQKTVELELI
ncbi:MAG: 4Fe-4S dicluster domain-containing protein [Planctomycetaceae bacterium]|jgi:ferredoxin|nr:4Fe-4S dicluster domain-containing protein [Planctomycetaceae bacterium]